MECKLRSRSAVSSLGPLAKSPVKQNETKRNSFANAPNLKPLTPRQLNAIDLLVFGHADARVAKTLRIGRTTLWRWKQNPAFSDELSRRRERLLGPAADRFGQFIERALDVLKDQLKEGDGLTRFRAAKALLNLAGNGRFGPPPDPFEPALNPPRRRDTIRSAS